MSRSDTDANPRVGLPILSVESWVGGSFIAEVCWAVWSQGGVGAVVPAGAKPVMTNPGWQRWSGADSEAGVVFGESGPSFSQLVAEWVIGQLEVVIESNSPDVSVLEQHVGHLVAMPSPGELSGIGGERPVAEYCEITAALQPDRLVVGGLPNPQVVGVGAAGNSLQLLKLVVAGGGQLFDGRWTASAPPVGGWLSWTEQPRGIIEQLMRLELAGVDSGKAHRADRIDGWDLPPGIFIGESSECHSELPQMVAAASRAGQFPSGLEVGQK